VDAAAAAAAAVHTTTNNQSSSQLQLMGGRLPLSCTRQRPPANQDFTARTCCTRCSRFTSFCCVVNEGRGESYTLLLLLLLPCTDCPTWQIYLKYQT
jgi:hypothetical protein